MRIGLLALPAILSLYCSQFAIGQSLRPTIDLGWLRAVQQQHGWKVVRSTFVPSSGDRINVGDSIRAVGSQKTDACGPLTAIRIFDRIGREESTVTVVRDGTPKILHLFPGQEPLIGLAPPFTSFRRELPACSMDDTLPVLTLPDSSGQSHVIRYGPKWMLLHIWSTFCPACWKDIPALNEISIPPPDNLAVVVVAVNDDARTIEAFSLQRPIQFEKLLGGTWDRGAIVEHFRPVELPADVLIDPLGTIVFVGAGSDSLRSALELMKRVSPP